MRQWNFEGRTFLAASNNFLENSCGARYSRKSPALLCQPNILPAPAGRISGMNQPPWLIALPALAQFLSDFYRIAAFVQAKWVRWCGKNRRGITIWRFVQSAETSSDTQHTEFSWVIWRNIPNEETGELGRSWDFTGRAAKKTASLCSWLIIPALHAYGKSSASGVCMWWSKSWDTYQSYSVIAQVLWWHILFELR